MKICITGSIGSGKSCVLEIAKTYSPNCYSCDEINNHLLQNVDYLKILQQNFGEDILVNGVLDRKKLALIIFTDDNKRELLNSLSHPKIREIVEDIFMTVKGNVFIEVPLLIESGLAPYFDKIWLVDSDFDVRLTRIVNRDKLNVDFALSKIQAQIKNEEALKRVATDTIYNNGDIETLDKQVQKLMQELNG